MAQPWPTWPGGGGTTVRLLQVEHKHCPLVAGTHKQWPLIAGSHLEFLQHDGLVGKAQVAASKTQLLGKVVQVHLGERQ